MQTIVVLTGAGISAESGIKTFRDTGGLWEQHSIKEVATYDAWLKNPLLVIEFYNQRRRQLSVVRPNAAHNALVKLEQKFRVQIITQNVDDLHERAGSSSIMHLHGELTKVRSSRYYDDIRDIGYTDLHPGDLCARGSQLRPHIVWFGEAVPLIHDAAELVSGADVLLVIGTSLQVYPAADLLHYAPSHCRLFLIDPHAHDAGWVQNCTFVAEKAGTGVPAVVEQLLSGN